jgi:hypothetical protein
MTGGQSGIRLISITPRSAFWKSDLQAKQWVARKNGESVTIVPVLPFGMAWVRKPLCGGGSFGVAAAASRTPILLGLSKNKMTRIAKDCPFAHDVTSWPQL